MSRKKLPRPDRFPEISAGFRDHLRASGIIPEKPRGPAFPCTCGKGLRTAEALRAHMQAMGCRNGKKRKRAERQRKLRAAGITR